ncbi:MAG: hypothetical protein EPN40_02890 [Rhodanobacteraceae bacterium]|nr:MAG: hypothetical protein EPN40_02890 [Rhodanobacteraceae bacterium]
MLTRRQLIAGTVAGGAVLAAAVAYGPRPSPDGRDAVIAAIAPVMLDGALPAQGSARQAALRGVVHGVDRAVEGLTPEAQHELARLFALLGFPLTRRLLAGVRDPWPDADPREIEAFLTSWRRHRVAQLRSAYDALHQLTLAAWYGNPVAWCGIGYPGPPKVG